MDKLYLSYDTIASEATTYWTPSQNSSFSISQPINFKNAQNCGGGDNRISSAGLQEYFYLDSEYNHPRWRKTE